MDSSLLVVSNSFHAIEKVGKQIFYKCYKNILKDLFSHLITPDHIICVVHCAE